jgi:hypothetical protein
MAHKYYLSPLKRLRPRDGLGIYEAATGACVAYTDGGSWFHAMDGGRPLFYASAGALFHADGSMANIDADLSPLKPSLREGYRQSLAEAFGDVDEIQIKGER